MLLMGKSTISMAIFNSKLWVHQRVDAPSEGGITFWWTNIAIENGHL